MPSFLDYLLRYGGPDPDAAAAQADVPSGDLLAHITGGLAKNSDPFAAVGAGPLATQALNALAGAHMPSMASVARGIVNGATGAAHELYDSGPGFTDRFLKGQIDPSSEDAAGGALGAAGVAMTGSMPFEAPAGALRMFGGRNAATADHAALAQAQKLAETGADRKAIWDQTGWFQGADDKWRFEIPDNAAKVGTAAEQRLASEGKTNGNAAATLWHKDLYDAYPELRQVRVAAEATPIENGQGVVGGSYEPKFGGGNGMIMAKAPGPDPLQSVLLHEMQHGIQNREGFGLGGSPNDPAFLQYPSVKRAAKDGYQAQENALYDLYKRHAGEVEARNVQARRDLTPEQRRATPPWETQDVPDEMQIVRMGGDGPQMSAPIRAYHGSPHDFDAFSLSKIGTGEGNQAFGSGLYFAEKEGVAKSYRDALAAPAVGTPEYAAVKALRNAGDDREAAASALASQSWSRPGRPPQVAPSTQAAIDLLRSEKPVGGRMYEVGIDADPARFLHWDKPLSEQPAAVRDAIASGGRVTRAAAVAENPNMTGGEYYKLLGNPDAASMTLNKVGVPGIKYADAGSRGIGEGTHNYVTFSDDIVKILRKYGLAGLAALGAGQGAVSNLGMGAPPQGMSN